MSNIDYYVNRVIEEIKSESVYRQYTTSLEKLNANPEIKRQVDELRRLNYQAQVKNDDTDSYDTIDDIDDTDSYDTIDDIDDKINELSCIPEVNQFLEAEAALCRLLQDISVRVHEAIHLDVPDLN